jgi:8-oxo-dGTP pyrophosphatase MutT (NUDIX family)
MSEFRTIDVARVEGRLAPFDWAWAREERDWIDARWAKLHAERPQMFDGRVLMAHRWAQEGDIFRADYFETRFSRFLCWREAGRPGRVANCFAMAALRAADGAYLLGEMGAHTANAGKIYFPAGTPDADDLVGDAVDLAGSAVRELGEETGLTPDMIEVEPRWSITQGSGMIACFRPMRLRMGAEEAVAFIHARLDAQWDRELARIHVVRQADDIDAARMPPFLAAFLTREFGG